MRTKRGRRWQKRSKGQSRSRGCLRTLAIGAGDAEIESAQVIAHESANALYFLGRCQNAIFHATDRKTAALITGILREQDATDEAEAAGVRDGGGGRRPEVAIAGDIEHLARVEREEA